MIRRRTHKLAKMLHPLTRKEVKQQAKKQKEKKGSNDDHDDDGYDDNAYRNSLSIARAPSSPIGVAAGPSPWPSALPKRKYSATDREETTVSDTVPSPVPECDRAPGAGRGPGDSDAWEFTLAIR